MSLKWPQISHDLLRLPLNAAKGVLQRVQDLLDVFEAAIVRRMNSGVMPDRFAISNRRLIWADEQNVTFAYKDYTDDAQQKTMTLRAEEFVRRFCLHILPERFVKIRHFTDCWAIESASNGWPMPANSWVCLRRRSSRRLRPAKETGTEPPRAVSLLPAAEPGLQTARFHQGPAGETRPSGQCVGPWDLDLPLVFGA